MAEHKLRGSTAVVVLGMHRSGTSVFSNALQELGVYLGGNLIPGAVDNPKGFFEDADINIFHEELLSKMGCVWHSVLVDELPKKLLESRLEELCALLGDKFGGQPLWSFKDPRTVRFMGLWEQVFDRLGVNARYIMVVRHPLSIASSLKKRDGFTFPRGLALTLLHQLEGLEAMLKHGGLVVDYDRMMEEPVGQAERLGSFLDIDLSRRKENIAKFTDDFLDRGLRHTKYSSKSTSHDYELEGKCLELFTVLDQFAAVDSPDGELLGRAAAIVDSVREYLWSQTAMLDAMNGQSQSETRMQVLEEHVNNILRSNEFLMDQIEGTGGSVGDNVDALHVIRNQIVLLRRSYFYRLNLRLRKVFGRPR